MLTLNVRSLSDVVLGPADSDNPTDKDDSPVQRLEARLMKIAHGWVNCPCEDGPDNYKCPWCD